MDLLLGGAELFRDQEEGIHTIKVVEWENGRNMRP